jgi:hypothetical protein
MKLRLFITAIMLGLAMPAVADYVTIEEAYEARLSEVRLPRGPMGTIAFKPCSTCDVQTKRVDANTRWLINGKAVPLREFREAMDKVVNREKEAVTVLHHLEKDRVTAVSVYL